MWKRKRRRYKKKDQEYYSISNKLRSENKINDEFEIMLGSISLEELIGLRLELAAKSVNNKLYGFDILRKTQKIAKDAVLKYAYSASRTQGEAASFLGITRQEFTRIMGYYKIKSYFQKDEI